jgi:hypothetical protein
MLGIQHFLEAESSFISFLSDMDPDCLIAATIHRNLVGVYERMGRSVKACASARISLEILLKHNTFQDNELANIYSNMGYALVSAYKAAEGLSYLDTAVKLAKSCPEPECYQRYTLDRFLRNRDVPSSS